MGEHISHKKGHVVDFVLALILFQLVVQYVIKVYPMGLRMEEVFFCRKSICHVRCVELVPALATCSTPILRPPHFFSQTYMTRKWRLRK